MDSSVSISKEISPSGIGSGDVIPVPTGGCNPPLQLVRDKASPLHSKCSPSGDSQGRLRACGVHLLAAIFIFSACTQQEVSLKGTEDQLAKPSTTSGQHQVIYPDDSPSVPDGKQAWQQMNCAVCHADTGKGVKGNCSLNLADKAYMRTQKPVDQFEFISFGRPGLNHHPVVSNKLSRRQIWDLVFYVRSLADPLLSDAQIADMDSVFGSNCAVCHGKKGYGDGPLGRNLEPQPANFRNFARFYDRTDDVLYDHIANGIKWEGMPNFLGKEDKAKNVKFDQEYIWKLVQFVRHFHETNQPTLAQTLTQSQSKPEGK